MCVIFKQGRQSIVLFEITFFPNDLQLFEAHQWLLNH